MINAVNADDYNSIPLALAAAVSLNKPIVYLTPAKIYTINAAFTIPQGVTLDGGGRGVGGYNGAIIKAGVVMDYMVQLAQYSQLTGCRIHANNGNATNGLLIQSNFPSVTNCYFESFTNASGAVFKCGGSLYPRFEHNVIANAAGWALDALNSYSPTPLATYYGINHGESRGNVWGGRKGVRVEGLWSSYNDDWEIALDGTAALTVGDTIQSQVNLYAPYFEISKGLASALVAIEVKGSARLALWGGEAYGDNSVGSIFCKSATAYGISNVGIALNRFEKGFSGALANNAPVVIGGIQLVDVGAASDLSNLNNAKIGMNVL